jgi:hypothetical protein
MPSGGRHHLRSLDLQGAATRARSSPAISPHKKSVIVALADPFPRGFAPLLLSG